MNETPLISVIIPTHNRAHLIGDTLDSVLAQTYTYWECIIVDDGSTDNTQEVLAAWQKKDSRFKPVLKTDGGATSKARNEGMKHAQGDYILFLDSDDLIAPDKLKASVDLVLLAGKDVVAVSNFKYFTDTPDDAFAAGGGLCQENLTHRNILLNWDETFTIPIHCGLFPATVFAGLRFEENLKGKEDWLFWIGISRKVVDFVFLDRPLAFYRVHAQNKSRSNAFKDELRFGIFKELKTHLPEAEYEDFLIQKNVSALKKIDALNARLRDTENSEVYRLGMAVRKGLSKTGLLFMYKKLRGGKPQ